MKLEKVTFGDKAAYVDMERVVAIFEQDDTETGGLENQVYLGFIGFDAMPVDWTLDEAVKKVRYFNSRA